VNSGFTAVDALVVVLYLAGTTALGIWVGRRQKGSKDYFVAGRQIPWWAVLFSIVATETSALTFISIPGLAYLGNLGFLQVVAGYVLGRIGVALLLLPRYYQGEIVTVYTLLQQRFGLATRRFTSIVFMATRAMADSVRIFATAIPVALIIGDRLPTGRAAMMVSIIILGAVTIIYTYKGGMRAVVWTEILQATVYLLGGVSAIVILGSAVEGGWPAILSQAGAAGKFGGLDFSFDISRAHTVWAGLIGGGFLSMASHGADQLIVQRLLSSRNLREAQRAVIGSGIVVFAQMALFLVVGVGLWVHFGAEALPSDSVFPRFIIEQMPAGLTGLLVAAIIAAAMSTQSGSINSLAAASTHDIYMPLTGRAADDPATFRAARVFTLAWGIALTGGALLFRDQGTPAVIVALGVASFTYGGLLGVFFLGNFWPRALQRDAIVGLSLGILTMAFVVFAGWISAAFPSMAYALGPFARIAWPWYVLIGTSITMIVGMVSSLSHPPPERIHLTK
jgi:SSS family solute:Na+ symporter